MFIPLIIILFLHNSMFNVISCIELEEIVDEVIGTLDDKTGQRLLHEKLQNHQDRVDELAVNILPHYTILKDGINSSTKFEAETLRDFAIRLTQLADNVFLRDLNEFIELIVPTKYPNRPAALGLQNMYANYVRSKEEEHKWCDNEQAASDFIYKTFRFVLDVVSKGYWVLLQSYEIRKAFDKSHKFAAEMKFFEGQYEKVTTAITANTKNLLIDAPTIIHRCEPHHQKRGETYLEMEKLLQGIVVSELTLNRDHTAYHYCSHFDKVPYYQHEYIRSDGDWKCDGLMYNCFRSYLGNLCKPSTKNRRIDGFTTYSGNFEEEGQNPAIDMGNLTNCYNNNYWSKSDWNEVGPSSLYIDDDCACICDDFNNPQTLRNFDSQHVLTDYQNNMVITGIRLRKISWFVSFDIQQGKLEKFGSINPSTVHWRSRSEIENENAASRPRPIRLNYDQRGVYLDTLHVKSDEAIIGVRFQWDLPEKNVVLAILVAKVDFPKGQIFPATERWLFENRSNNNEGTEIILNEPHIPTLCTRNVPIREENKFIRFQTSDWVKDAAQSTVPYIDIQPVVTSPPSPIGGIGLNYRNTSECGGYIAVELYSFNYSELINKTPIPTIDIEKNIAIK